MNPPVTLPHEFADFADDIKNLSPSGPSERELYRFLLPESHDNIRIYYAPFDWINTKAKISVVGITPGQNSMVNAFRVASSALKQGLPIDEASELGKRAGSFSNMRATIAEMFDDLGMPEALGIVRSLELFSSKYDLLHPTSCIRYPVLTWSRKDERWANYTGHNPKLLKWDTSLRFIETVLADELQRIPDALIVPCGKAVDSALEHLSAKKMIDSSRVLFGFPHASRANGHRKRLFAEKKDQLRRTLADWRNRFK